MQNFFTPKSIAVIGVSKEPHKVGHIIFKNLYQKFTTYPVHPTEKVFLEKQPMHILENLLIMLILQLLQFLQNM